jgi:guanylate kinase
MTPTSKFQLKKIMMASKYSPPSDLDEMTKSTPKTLPTPKIGDIVRYYDVDGGKSDGQILVGKISLVQSIISPPSSSSSSSSSSSNNSASSSTTIDGTNKWLVEIAEMEDVGDGYYAEYPYRKRPRPALRKLEHIAPLPASYVRTEDAYKVPIDRTTGRPIPTYTSYDIVGYKGPDALIINDDIVSADGIEYERIKFILLRDTAIAGIVGTIFVELYKGAEAAVVYAGGALAGVAYLFFLGVKTDTLGDGDSRLGSNISNVRFLFPVGILVTVASYNLMRGDSNPVSSPGMFSLVTPGQFGEAMIGFLTYRIPLFVRQLFPVASETIVNSMPGSPAMAVRVASDINKNKVTTSIPSSFDRDDNLVTILLVSGPQGTGKTTLVNRLLEEDDRFLRPNYIDRVSDGVKFERIESRGEFLEMDATGRYGLSSDGLLEATKKAKSTAKVVVVDADVNLAKKLVTLSGTRLVGVWIGLDNINKFESQLRAKIISGDIVIPDGETEEAVLRARVRQAVKDIEFGVVSGVFDFTILNEDIEDSVRQLKEAANYCFS